ncbi:MAG: hypothetical protein JKX72_01755 [Robiginitomaculum sp.]|nr:hypothetical protein [Robiginitomaculum sp.]
MFSTITPDAPAANGASATGAVAKIWDADANGSEGGLVDGDTWFDGSSGDFVGNEIGLNQNLAGVDGIVVMGRDTASAETEITLANTARTRLTNFGEGDRIYIDFDASATVKDFTTSTIAVSGSGSGSNAVTVLQFFGVSGGAAGLLLSFEDRAGTPENESTLVAAGFTDAEVDSFEHSFEELANNAYPVIGG